MNETHTRLRTRQTMVGLEQIEAAQDDSHQVVQFPPDSATRIMSCPQPEHRPHLLAHDIDALPEAFRTVHVMRKIEDCTVEQTASQLEIKPQRVKTRRHRARRLLRTSPRGTLAAATSEALSFMGRRCASLTAAVIARLDTG